MDWITQPEAWIAVLTLIALELVLGVDNVIFISILAGSAAGGGWTRRGWGMGWLSLRGWDVHVGCTE